METQLYKEIKVISSQRNKIYTGDKKTYKGISTVNPDSTNAVLYDIALIKQDIINHFHIRQGEKLSDPTFGTIIWDILFEPMTEQIRFLITKNVTRIVNSDPRVTIDRVIVDDYEHGIQIECDLRYIQYNISERMRLQFDENAGFLST